MTANGDAGFHIQVKFVNSDVGNLDIPETVISVSQDSTPENFNQLINAAAELANDEWKETAFDFLINGALFRGSLIDFIVDNNVSQESLVEVQCFVRQPTPEPDLSKSQPDWISDVQVTPEYIISANYNGEVCVYTHAGKLVGEYQVEDSPLKCLRVFNVGEQQCVAVGSQEQVVTVCKLESMTKNVAVTPWQIYRGHERSVECVTANSDGSRVVSGGFDSLLKVWTTESGSQTEYSKTSSASAKKKRSEILTKTPMVTLQSHRDAVVGVEWHPLNAKQVVTASVDHNIIVWDLELAGFVNRLHGTKSFTSLSLNPTTGLVITGSADNVARLWDLNSHEGTLVKQTFTAHSAWITDVHWSADNQYQFATASFDKTVRMWDVRSPRASLFDIASHDDRVLAVDWSCRSLIASGGTDCQLKTFKVK